MISKYLKLMFFAAFITVLFPACKKTEAPGLENSGLLVLGDQKDVELITIVPYPDGGFIAGAQTRMNENQEIWILKYNNNFDLEWQRTIGGNMSNKLFKIFIDKNNNILVGGLTYGYGQDTLPLSKHKFWWPYFHLLSRDGNTIWEKALPDISVFAGSGSGIEERISDIIQDGIGNYIVGGEFAHSSRIHSLVINLQGDGNLQSAYDFSDDYYGKIDALFNTSNSYSIFNYWDSGATYKPIARLFQIKQSDTSGTNLFYNKHDYEWPWASNYANGNIAGLKLILANGLFTFNYIFTDKVYRYTYNPNTNEFIGNYIPLDMDHLTAANTTFDGNFIFADDNGTIYETTSDFSVVKKFKTNWQGKHLCKLFNNDYVLGVEQGKTIYLIHYNKEGKISGHE